MTATSQSPLEKASALLNKAKITGYAKDSPPPQQVQRVELLPASTYELKKRQGSLTATMFKVGDPNFSWRDKQGSIEKNAVRVAESNRIALERIEGRKAMATATTAPKALRTPANAKEIASYDRSKETSKAPSTTATRPKSKAPSKPKSLVQRVAALSPAGRRNLAAKLAALRAQEVAV